MLRNHTTETVGNNDRCSLLLYRFEEILKPIEQVRLFRNTETDEDHKNNGDPD